MALGTTNINLRGNNVPGDNGLYKEMGKTIDQSNVSLGQAKYGVNDIDITAYATSNPAEVRMSYWQSYDSMDLRFRFNTATTNDNDTYDGEDTQNFGSDTTGVTFTANGATDQTTFWAFDGNNDTGEFEDVNGGDAYKQGATGTMAIAFWMRTSYRGGPPGSVDIIANNQPIGSISQYRGYRIVLMTDNQIRVVRGDGDGAGSQDRRSFGSNNTITDGEWNFIVWQGVYNSTSVGVNNNYMWIWNPTNEWTNGVSFLSGTGGDLEYNNTDAMVISPAPAGRYLNGDIGGIWVFNQAMATADIELLKDNTASTFI